METPQKRQKSWLSSLTGLVSGSRTSERDQATFGAMRSRIDDAPSANRDAFASRLRSARARPVTPPRHSGTFSAPAPDSPESPVKRASPTMLAQRKIHERPQGPSGRGPSSTSASFPAYGESSRSLYPSYSGSNNVTATPRRTNFSSATTPRNMFRDSISREMPAFTFTPRVPPNTLRASFPAATPGRSYRAPAAELTARDLAKTSSSELFAMKIPDPDPKLSGEAVANMVPKDMQSGTRSVYANEYLAHLCPPDFTDEQRNQFFCILDLRRLKYAADEVFLKKDWRLNILNFAKEYEKNRSLIMLRYGLYEFKTVKVSKDVFQKWKADNNVPDLEDEAMEGVEVANTTAATPKTAKSPASKVNGTEGILRAEKRKAQDNIDPAASSASSASSAANANKRTRSSEFAKPADREPLTETSTPTLNKSKRKTMGFDDVEQPQHIKPQKGAAPASAPAPSGTPSATRALFEKFANSSAKAPAAAETPSIQISKPTNEASSTPKPSPFKTSSFGQPSKQSASGSLARSVLESGLKASAMPSNNNIFGYLSDASSAKGSGNDNADADAEDTDESDGQEDPEPQKAKETPSAAAKETPKPTPSLFGAKPAAAPAAPVASTGFAANSSASSDASGPAAGRSLFDRVNKASDGQPIRMFGNEGASATPSASLFGSKAASGQASPDKEKQSVPSLFSANKTWNPDTPIKFAGNGDSSSQAKSLFGSATPSAGALPASSSTSSLFGAAAAPKEPASFSGSLFGAAGASAAPSVPATKAAEPAKPAAPSLFGASAAPAASSSSKPAAAPLFGLASTSAAPSAPAAAPSLFGASTTASATPTSSLFGKKPEGQPSFSSSNSLFGASSAAKPAAPSLQSQTLFGNTPKADAPSLGTKRGADEDSTAAPAAAKPSIFGAAASSTASNEPQAKKTLFGSSTPAAQPSSSGSLFSFGASNANGAADKAAEPAKSLFGSSSAAEPAKTQSSSLFGSAAPATTSAASGSLFSFGGNSTATTSAPAPASSFTFGSSAGQQPQPQQQQQPTSLFGNNTTVSAPSSFTFSAGGPADTSSSFHNPFASGDSASQPSTSFNFGSQAGASQSFTFGAGSSTPAAAAPAASNSLFAFGSQPASQPAATTGGNLFGGQPASGSANGTSMFSFGGSSQPSGTPLFGQQPPAANGSSMFNLAPPMGGTSTGTDTPLTNLGGASSLATTPATGTPEPGATQETAEHNGHQADGDEAPQEQIRLTDGGPGEEDESVVYEVRAKAMRLVPAKDESGGGPPAAKDKKSPWQTEGVGPLRILKHKKTNAVRLLLRAEPRGNVAVNRALLPDFNYRPEPNAKYVKLTTANESGKGLETWMMQVKTKEAAQQLADALEEHKAANKK